MAGVLLATILATVATVPPVSPAPEYAPGSNALGLRFSGLLTRLDPATGRRLRASDVGIELGLYYVHRGVSVCLCGWIAPASVRRDVVEGGAAWSHGDDAELDAMALTVGYRLDRGRHAFGPALGLGGAWLRHWSGPDTRHSLSFLAASAGVAYQYALLQSRTFAFSDYFARYRMALTIQAVVIKALTRRPLDGPLAPGALMLTFGLGFEKAEMRRAPPRL